MKPTIINALYFFSTSLFLRIDPSQPSDAIRVYFDNTESDEQITAAFAAEADTSYSFPERNIMNRDPPKKISCHPRFPAYSKRLQPFRHFDVHIFYVFSIKTLKPETFFCNYHTISEILFIDFFAYSRVRTLVTQNIHHFF